MAEFGESLLYIPLRGDVDAKRVAKINLEPRFIPGIFLELADRSDEIIVAGVHLMSLISMVKNWCNRDKEIICS